MLSNGVFTGKIYYYIYGRNTFYTTAKVLVSQKKIKNYIIFIDGFI